MDCRSGSALRKATSTPSALNSWSDDVDPAALQPEGPFFLELFAGKAGISEAVLLQGVPILPPVDIVVDIVDWNFWNKILAVITAGLVFFLHCGTPCNTFASARKNDGGPPPLRSALEPMGLQELSEDNQALVLLGNIFLFRTVEACRLVFILGGNFSIENPLLSLMWQTQAMQQLISETPALALDFDQCAFGAPSVKPTRLLCSTDLLDDVCVRCPGNPLARAAQGA